MQEAWVQSLVRELRSHKPEDFKFLFFSLKTTSILKKQKKAKNPKNSVLIYLIPSSLSPILWAPPNFKW